MPGNIIVEFEDHGQDFLRWEIDSGGNIIDSWPFQASIWCKYWVMNLAKLKIGEMVKICEFKRKHFSAIDVNDLTIKYPIIKIGEGKINDPVFSPKKEVSNE